MLIAYRLSTSLPISLSLPKGRKWQIEHTMHDVRFAICYLRCPPLHAADQRRECSSIQTRITDQDARRMLQAHEVSDVAAVNAAAINDANVFRNERQREQVNQRLPNHLVGGLRLVRIDRLTGTDNPDRFVGDDQLLIFSQCDTFERPARLLDQRVVLMTGLPLLERLPDADNRHQAGGERRGDFTVDHLICLTQVLPALGMADDDVPAANLMQRLG